MPGLDGHTRAASAGVSQRLACDGLVLSGMWVLRKGRRGDESGLASARQPRHLKRDGGWCGARRVVSNGE
jgi:hypothetical protein